MGHGLDSNERYAGTGSAGAKRVTRHRAAPGMSVTAASAGSVPPSASSQNSSTVRRSAVPAGVCSDNGGRRTRNCRFSFVAALNSATT